MRTIRSLSLLPAVICIYYIVHSLFFDRGLPYTNLPILLLDSLILFVYAYSLLLLSRRSRSHASRFAASLALIFTLFYASLRELFFSNSLITAFVQNYFWNKNNLFFILLIAVCSWTVMRFLKGSPVRAANAAAIFIIFFSLLSGMDVANYIREQPQMAVVRTQTTDTVRLTGEKPDVYFIIFDSETSPDGLKNYLGYDNDSIVQCLRSRGFFVAQKSRSNYNMTPYSLCSTLNMAYMANNAPRPTNEEFPESMTSTVVKMFSGSGYAIHNLSFFNIESVPRMFPFPQYNFWDKTLFYFLYDRKTNYTYREFASRQRAHLRSTIDSLTSIIHRDATGPKFVYAHFYVPHPPAFITRDESEVPGGSMENQNIGLYLDQVRYSYDLMLRMTEQIPTASNGKAIIIIQGDHGYRYLKGPQKMDEQFDVFKAVYFPHKNYSLLNDSTTSVNTFRIALNSEFGTTFPLLPDSFHNVFIKTLNLLP
jgi:hypothetical protein